MIEYTHHGTCNAYKQVPKGAVITRVNGRDVEGFCEACGKPILEKQPRNLWAHGVMTCWPCGGPKLPPTEEPSE